MTLSKIIFFFFSPKDLILYFMIYSMLLDVMKTVKINSLSLPPPPPHTFFFMFIFYHLKYRKPFNDKKKKKYSISKRKYYWHILS